MKHHLPVFAALAVSLIGSAFVPSLKADEWDAKTIITISQPVAVEGTTLPACQYVLKLQDNTSTRDVVYIFNGDETRLITAVMAIPMERQRPTDNTVFSFYDSSAGEPAALHTWFYPGALTGLEFLQPRSTVLARSGTAPGAAKKTPTRSAQPTVPAGPNQAGG
jgi:hypothetical protein